MQKSIEEMQHAQLLIDRIIFLEGVPEIARYDVIEPAPTSKSSCSTTSKSRSRPAKPTAKLRKSSASEDAASREIVERIIRESEESLDWLEAQLELIETIGLELYLQSQMGEEEGDKSGDQAHGPRPVE
ncbi:MAG: ferritin-like domain-containing protein [Planctomycetaceae bacterium]